MVCAAIRPSIRSAIQSAIVEAFCARLSRADLLAFLFPQTAPGVTNPGFAIDYSDLTEEKLAWRKNWFTETEFRNGVADAPTRSPGITAGTISGYAGAIQFPLPVIAEYAYKTAALTQGTPVAFMLIVEMDDDLGPPVVSGNGLGTDMTVVVGGSAVPAASVTVVSLGGRRYSVRVPNTSAQTTTTTYGVVRYLGNSMRTLRVTAYHLNLGGTLLPYQMLTDVSTEFLAAFPYHSLFRESTFSTACYQLEDPCGGALDLRFGGARAVADLAAGWSTFGAGMSVVDGQANFTAAPVGAGIRKQAALTLARWYEITYEVVSISGGSVRAYAGSGALGTLRTTPGKYRDILQCATSTDALIISLSTSTTAIVKNFECHEVYGDHAVQATVGDRPVISAKYNQLANSAWQGGGAVPTGWTQPVAASTTASAGVDSNVIYRFPVVAGRGFFAAPLATLAVGQIMSLGVTVESIASGSITAQETVISAPSSGAGTSLFYVDGSLVTSSTPVSAGQRVVCVTTCTTAGTFIPRAGAGCSGNVTVDVSLSRPMLTPGAAVDAPRYQRTNADSTYDYAGFLVGARFNGVNSWMQISATNSLVGRSKLTLAVSYRKDAEPTITQDCALLEISSVYANGPGRAVIVSSINGNNQTGAYVRGSTGTVGSQTPTLPPATGLLLSAVDWTTGAPSRAVRKNGAFIGGTPGTAVGGEGAVVDAQPIFIGRRGGVGPSLNGMIYRAFGYGVDFTTQYTTIESWLNERVKVTLA